MKTFFTIIIGIVVWVVQISMTIVVMCLGIVCYHWIMTQIPIIYPDQTFSGWFRGLILMGCMGMCLWILGKVHGKPTLSMKVSKKVVEHETI